MSCAAMLAFPVSSSAEVFLTERGSVFLDEDVDTVISGQIAEVRGDSFTLLNGANEIKVSTEEIDIDNADDLLGLGMNVTVHGEYDDGVLLARRIIETPK